MMKICDTHGNVLFSDESATVRPTLEAAVRAGAYLARADLARADLAGAYLADAYLADAYLAGADLAGAYLADAYLAGAYLADANLARAYLADANLADANLTRAYLARADLIRAYLTRANLTGADLAGADLADADLAGADLTRAKGVSAELVTPLLMLLDQPGPIRAYKLVTRKGHSPYATENALEYTLGAVIEVPDADTNPAVQCGAGINVATLDWCLRYAHDRRVMIIEFTAADIACIPTATDGKFRLHRCTVVGEKDISGLIAQPQSEWSEIMTLRRLTWRASRAPEFASVIDASGAVRVVPWLEWAGLVHDNLFGPDAAFAKDGDPEHINDYAQLAYLVALAMAKVAPGVEGLAAWLAEMSRASGDRHATVRRIYDWTVANPDGARAIVYARRFRRELDGG